MRKPDSREDGLHQGGRGDLPLHQAPRPAGLDFGNRGSGRIFRIHDSEAGQIDVQIAGQRLNFLRGAGENGRDPSAPLRLRERLQDGRIRAARGHNGDGGGKAVGQPIQIVKTDQ